MNKVYPSNAPAIVADIMVANVAAITALNPSLEISACRSGAIPPMPPICIAMELKFAKPHNA
jgi:hypothetical protein